MKQLLCIAIMAIMLGVAPLGHAAGISAEYKVKAAYLYNFAKFIHWPDEAFSDSRAPLVIGVLGDSPLAAALVPLQSRMLRERQIEVRSSRTLADVQGCHLLYVSPSENKNLLTILKAFAHQHVVTVGEQRNFVRHGGTIQFVTRRDRLRFSINLAPAKRNNIQIKAQLLSLAAEVVEDE